MSENNTNLALKEGEVINGTVVKIYVTTRNTDSTEGRGMTVDHSYHKDERFAIIAGKDIGVMGSDGEVVTRLAIKLSDGRYFLLQKGEHSIALVSDESEVQAAATLRVKALQKLSPAERIALGL